MALLLLALAAGDADSSLPLKPGWALSRELKSEHATQAAAADDRFVYAVSSVAVARYDRATGKLLGVSTGKATHLNSAFLWKGKVYCAHSNYPAKPDQSDIKVFDPETLKLTTFHTFDKPAGSLTWCVHDGKHWWCCFAHYKEDNAKTVLLKMDDGFKELARWTFPKVVVDDWDGMSASGGLWDGDDLLVIGHHFKAIYRLRLPKKGGVLEFVEALDCPFPGQGIAADPKTGGLVGIDRKKRAVVFAGRKK
jgi:hypothetical protein